VAITLVPMLSTQFMRNVQITLEEENAKDIFNRLLNKFKIFYGKVLEKALRRRKTVLAIVAAAFVGSFALLPVVGMELMPTTDSGQITITATLPSGSQLEETDIVVEEINERLKQFEDIIKVNYVSIGGSMDGISAGS